MTEQHKGSDNALENFLAVARQGAQRELTTEELATINEFNGATATFDETLGVDYVAAGPAGVSMRLEITREHLQPWGITHGGVYAAMAESAGSVASFLAAGAEPAVMGTSNVTDFLRPSVAGDVIVTKAIPEHLGRTTHLWRIEHRNEATDKLVALTHLKTFVARER